MKPNRAAFPTLAELKGAMKELDKKRKENLRN
jgi:hypothetical protein